MERSAEGPYRYGLLRGNWPECVSDHLVPVRLIAFPSLFHSLSRRPCQPQ